MNFNRCLDRLATFRNFMLASLFLYLVTSGFALLTGKLALTHDAIHWYGSFLHFIRSLSHGLIPMWDPFSLSGAPFSFLNNMTGNLDPFVLMLIPIFKFFKASAFLLFQFNYVFRLLMAWLGMYLVYKKIFKDKWAAGISSSLVFFLFLPNTYTQNGSAITFVYAPWIIWCLIGAFDFSKTLAARRWNFLLALFFVGINVNLYLPSYGYVLASMVSLCYLLIALGPRKTLSGFQIFKNPLFILACVVVMGALVGPFAHNFKSIMSADTDYFNFHRSGVQRDSSDLQVNLNQAMEFGHTTEVSTIHNLMGLFFSTYDTRNYYDSMDRSFWVADHFLTLGNVGFFLFILSLCVGWRQKSFWVFFIPFLYITLLMYLPPHNLIADILRKYPSAGVIRILYNFVCHWYFCLGGLFCVSITWLQKANLKDLRKIALTALAASLVIRVALLTQYFNTLGKDFERLGFSNGFLAWSQREAFSLDGYLWLTALLLGFAFTTQKESWRKPLYSIVVVLSLIYFYKAQKNVLPFVTAPGSEWSEGLIHRYQESVRYEPVRVPNMPIPGDVQGFIGTVYGRPEAGSVASNAYGTYTKRMYDYLRFASLEKQKFFSGLGGQRFGFFDSVIRAKNAENAVQFLSQTPLETLQKSLLVETQKPLPGLASDKEAAPDTKTPLIAIGYRTPWYKFFDRFERIAVDGAAHPVDFDMTYSKLGYGHFLIFPEALLNYRIFNTVPNLAVRFLDSENYCLKRIHDWNLYGRTGLYPKFYSESPETCDIQVKDNTLQFSREFASPFITNDMGTYEGVDHPIREILFASLTVPTQNPLPLSGAKIQVDHFDYNSISFQVENPKAGLFYYADSYCNEWKAFVDGVSAEIIPAAFAFKSVFLNPGSHKIEFKFIPPNYSIIFLLFIVVSLVMGAGFVVTLARELRDSKL